MHELIAMLSVSVMLMVAAGMVTISSMVVASVMVKLSALQVMGADRGHKVNNRGYGPYYRAHSPFRGYVGEKGLFP